jgi:hypothetical protein
LFFLLAGFSSLPSLGFEIQLPSEVEFGLTETVAMEKQTIEGSPIPTGEHESKTAVLENKPQKGEASVVTIDGEKKRKKRAKTPDAGVEPSNSKDAGPEEELAGQADAGEPTLAAFAPSGTQLALRLDMERLRACPLADDVRSLLQVVPDWHQILDGSGLDPITDLDRLLIASPNLMRSRLVVAGQYAGGLETAQKAVANLAAARGKKARWRSEGGIAVAPWLNQDETERIVALVGPEMFTITRPDDLPRVLAVAKGLADRRAKEKQGNENIPSALLAMGEDVTLSLSIEGARQFVREDADGIPSRLEVTLKEAALKEDQEKEIIVNAQGFYDSDEQAEQAKKYWDEIRKRFMSHPLVLLIGMGGVLSEATIERTDATLSAQIHLTYQQARVLIGILQNALNPPKTPSSPLYEKPLLPPNPSKGPSQEPSQKGKKQKGK